MNIGGRTCDQEGREEEYEREKGTDGGMDEKEIMRTQEGNKCIEGGR